ncbi:MAG: hypothetical protein KQH63_16900 [Desulfobulbaceae bacterium]|nr:hypothetical protein [Desulfobulbaceae bacterium]
MKRQAKVENKIYSVEFQKRNGKVEVIIDNRCYLVDSSTINNGSFSLLIDGASRVIFVKDRGDHFSVALGGKNIDVRFYDPRALRSVDEMQSSLKQSRQIILAPMAGRIVRLQVRLGDMVSDGAGLVVLEAMKMENELKSQAVGCIKEIFVSENEVVIPGQQLMVIE